MKVQKSELVVTGTSRFRLEYRCAEGLRVMYTTIFKSGGLLKPNAHFVVQNMYCYPRNGGARVTVKSFDVFPGETVNMAPRAGGIHKLHVMEGGRIKVDCAEAI